MQFCPDKEAKCPQNDQLLDDISNILIENSDVHACTYIRIQLHVYIQ